VNIVNTLGGVKKSLKNRRSFQNVYFLLFFLLRGFFCFTSNASSLHKKGQLEEARFFHPFLERFFCFVVLEEIAQGITPRFGSRSLFYFYLSTRSRSVLFSHFPRFCFFVVIFFPSRDGAVPSQPRLSPSSSP